MNIELRGLLFDAIRNNPNQWDAADAVLAIFDQKMEALNQLSKEYRKSMTDNVLHSWADDVVKAIKSI